MRPTGSVQNKRTGQTAPMKPLDAPPVDVASDQVDVNLKVARRAVEMIPEVPRIDFAHLTRETVESYVTAQKALLDVMTRPPRRHEYAPAETERPTRKKAAPRRKAAATTA